MTIAIGMVCTPAFATEVAGERSDKEDIVTAYAYMSIEDAEPELQEKILAARNAIIFSKSWSADGVEITIERADGTMETVPKFSELFPGWDYPNIESNKQDLTHHISPMSVSTVSYRYYLKNPSNITTSPFTAFYHNGSYVRTTVATLYASEHCNIGYTNYGTGESIGWLSYLYPGDSITLYTLGTKGFNCAVRASTYSSPGYSILTVTHDEPGSIL